MCGIVAIHSTETPISSDTLNAATGRLHHRGPDGRQTWISSSGRVGLGHARLSIIDLSGGAQPLYNEDKSIHVVVNGEFYDYERIQVELQKRGHKLRTKSDSEILIHLYEDYGLSCLKQLRGEYAFVLWDERNRLLIAGRDRFGIKPLYYSRSGDKTYFASEAKALFAAGVPAAWDREGFFQTVTAQAGPDRTFFRNVYQVPPGQFLVIKEDGHTRGGTYWDLNFPKAEQLSRKSDAEHVEELRDKLDEAVRLRLRADVPVGMYLSGGIDSSAIMGFASKYASKLDAYSIRFPEDPKHNEEAIAKETADRYGARVHFLTMSSDLAADHFVEAVAHWEDLPRSEWIVGKYLLSKVVYDHGTRVVLTGEGSDEMLGGYYPLVRDAILRGSLKMTEAQKAEIVAKWSAPWRKETNSEIESLTRVMGYAPTLLVYNKRVGDDLRPYFSKEFSREFASYDPYLSLLDYFDYPGQLEGREALAQSMYLWAKTIMPNFYLAQCGDRSEMAHSLEGRVPFLDHQVVELAREMPASVKIKDGVEKWVLREAVRPYITDSVFNAKKKAFVTQPSRVSDPGSRIGVMLQDAVRSKDFLSNPFFEQQKVLKLLDGLAGMTTEERHAQSQVLLTILGSSILQKAYRL